MKLIRTVALSAIVAMGAFASVTYTSCTKDACKDVVCNNGGVCSDGNCTCTFAYTGAKCENQVRAGYYFSYKGTGQDTDGNTYTDYKLKFYALSDDAKTLGMDILTDNNESLLSFTVTLQTATTFTIVEKTDSGTVFTGTGTVDGSKASAVITGKDATSTTVITFASMLKQ